MISTMRHADQIAVMNRGRIVEQRIHEELVVKIAIMLNF